MEELAGGSSRSAHHSFPAVTRCHALLRCLFNGTLPLPSAPFPPPRPQLSLSPSSVLAAAHFPSSSAAAYKPSLCFRIYLTILSSIDSSLTPLLVHPHTQGCSITTTTTTSSKTTHLFPFLIICLFVCLSAFKLQSHLEKKP
jgi:hypothetical protein